MLTISRIALASLVGLATITTTAQAQQREDFNWSRAIPAGRTLEIKGVSGDIHAVGTNGTEVKVHAEKHAKKSNVTEVQMVVLESANGVTICAVYPTPQRAMRRGGSRTNECTSGEHWSTNTENNDVTVDWTVEVPRGVQLYAYTINGDVKIEKLQSDVSANTTNGDVEVATTGLAHARTVNGSLDVSMGRATWANELRFSTVNGAIRVAFGGDLNAQVSAETVNGDIETDWPLTVRGRFGARSLNGVVGSGGRRLNLSTVNGDIEIRKR